MQQFNLDEKFPTKSFKDYVVSELPKIVDTRGFIYIVQDSVFPDFFKIGRTSDMVKRLTAYNSDKPYPSTNVTFITREFKNCTEVESKILDYLYKHTSPTTFKKEWFLIEHLPIAKELMLEAETTFE